MELDSETLAVILAFAASLITALIQYAQKKQGFKQGDAILASLKKKLGYVTAFADIFPQLKPLSDKLNASFKDVELGWLSGKINTDQLNVAISDFDGVYDEAMKLIASILKPKAA